MSISNGALLTYVGNWPAPPLTDGNYVNDVFNDLGNAGIVVRGFTGGPGILSALAGQSFNITLNLQIENGLGFNSTDDVVSVVRNAVYQETGNFPLTDSIPYVQADANSAPVATGQPGATTGAGAVPPTGTAAHQCGDPSWGFFDDPAQYVTCLSQKGLSTLGLVFIGLLIGIAFILFADHEV